MNANIGHLFIIPKAKGIVQSTIFVSCGYMIVLLLFVYFFILAYVMIFYERAFYPTM